MDKIRPVACCAVLVAAVACSQPLEFADWTIPVDEGVPVVEYASVPLDERAEAVEWVDELVIGDRGEIDARYAFGRPTDVAVDSTGQIYVVDSQSATVSVFDARGEYLRELGREGQGPGEFQQPRSVATLDDRVIVGASRNARWSHFDLAGSHIADHAYPRFDNLELMIGTRSGELVASTVHFTEADEIEWTIAAYAPQAEKLRTAVATTYTQTPSIQRGTRSTYFGAMPNAYPMAAASNTGVVYWSMRDEYQVLAVAPDAEPRWALRVAWTPSALPRRQIDEIMGMARNRYEDATEAEVNFPERQPAIARLLVDGHGHLYVFPYVYVPGDGDASAPVPVDVYGTEGERLFAGVAPPRSWTHAEGDFVYEIATDPETTEYVIRKARLVEPFD